MKIPTNEIMTAFQPPHMDTVTGLTTLGGYLISGSKDKNLRLWSMDSEFYNLKSTLPTFNEHITALESNLHLKV
jgi:WD40 repeat protein